MIPSLPSPDERLPRYQQLRDDLVRRIAAGEWAPGEAIHTEVELSTAYGVSTGTLRKAIDLLVAEGVLTRSQGRGTFVRRPRFDSSLFRFFRFKSASGNPVQPTARILQRSVEEPDDSLRAALQLGPDAKVIHLSRQRLVDGRVVLSEEIWVPRDGFEALTMLAPADFGDLLYPLYERLCHQVVATARETLRVARADAQMAQTLGTAPGDPVINVSRVALDYAGKPVECRSTWGAADGFQYEVEIR
ncbi:UTRA domain-containing protein [Ideonella sp. B508-1]|uniref:GntR family transcriptional regulator n=1 Tax=Ideonella sp. B508-1 TaxID=137716 RepID=UPI0003481717